MQDIGKTHGQELQICQERTKVIFCSDSSIFPATNTSSIITMIWVHILILLTFINLWQQIHNMTGIQLLENIVNFKTQIEFQLSWIEIADECNEALASN